MSTDRQRRLAEAVRTACLQAAIRGYEQAAMDGLCHEGAWECALDAIRAVDLDTLLDSLPEPAQQQTNNRNLDWF
ncbi:MAG: acetyltransferase [Chloroflexota bacterium]|nr:acetyltransferase [Chloroflexota bacterium]